MSQVKECTLTEAIKELSVLDKRIKKASTAPMASVIRADKQQMYPRGVSITPKDCAANMQSFEALLAYRDALRAAVLLSNNSETLEGFGMSVAAALDKKNRLEVLHQYYYNIANQVVAAEQVGRDARDAMNSALRKQVADVASGDDYATRVESARSEVIGRLEPTVYIPESVLNYVTTGESELTDFMERIDVALNLHNAKTTIRVVW